MVKTKQNIILNMRSLGIYELRCFVNHVSLWHMACPLTNLNAGLVCSLNSENDLLF